ncbi:hypothetical protein FPJ27_19615 [Burkholderia sp. MS455]|nr:hypothetical protein FPJ27_19615 [Burkholderia sp. MS455]
MKSVRNQPAAFRFDPTVKASLSLIAKRDGRSMANMLEWLIRKHCEVEGLGWPPQGCEALVTNTKSTPLTEISKRGDTGKEQKRKSDA